MNKLNKMPLALLSSAILLAGCSNSGSSSDSGSSPAGDEQTPVNRTVQGTVDGFGSVIVNGVHYESTAADFSIDDAAGSESDLHVGQVVTIIGSDNGVEGVALNIIYDVEVEGPVASLDALAGTFTVLGQGVVFDGMTVFEGITAATISDGSGVEVSGFSDGNGQIRATFIKADDSGEAELRGRISSLDEGAQTFTIGSQQISYANVIELDLEGAALANDLLVEVEGGVSGAVLDAAKIEAEDEHDFADHEGEVKLSGYITALGDGSITVAGMTVRYNTATEFEHGSSADLVVNTFVRVEGQVGADGSMLAEEIEYEALVKLELEGPVTSVGADTVSVMGVSASVDTRTRIRDERDDITYFNLSNVAVGDYVELRLTEEADGSLRALRLERDEDDREVQVTARVGSVDVAAATITLLGITVDMSAIIAVDLSALSVGTYLEVEGSYDGSMITATEAGEDDRYEDHEDDDDESDSDD
ncbi:MAG: hypothetical protein CMI08_12380 [Oceanospirillaceae bacterium]|uniref:DUF5666 domain-containing protein n=1 Tax=unclassified Thalassolituus TaxID=2624967 RepID=UPI000C699252|nr:MULTISPECIES: DUF5666 domain-containing protein [unclassified Thalassolituus]MAS24249.1 hypothetical protein [Oceanospirillaceae bacterium]MAX99972.1 hypothetical protein [Oceanospirillaceae bacterium]MBL36159.1 hypothetical protein [Oceanospirillaceae bacterium]MBS53069.1 hypothetical protein [Oceanospirillaceae bacterium]|tara:strand:- start:1007 stop:2434 length:1428 start_codon:yes stop_codon:yes gene_type:complete